LIAVTVGDHLPLHACWMPLPHWGIHCNVLEFHTERLRSRGHEEVAPHGLTLFPDRTVNRNGLTHKILWPLNQVSNLDLRSTNKCAELCRCAHSAPGKDGTDQENKSAESEYRSH